MVISSSYVKLQEGICFCGIYVYVTYVYIYIYICIFIGMCLLFSLVENSSHQLPRVPQPLDSYDILKTLHDLSINILMKKS